MVLSCKINKFRDSLRRLTSARLRLRLRSTTKAVPIAPNIVFTQTYLYSLEVNIFLQFLLHFLVEVNVFLQFLLHFPVEVNIFLQFLLHFPVEVNVFLQFLLHFPGK